MATVRTIAGIHLKRSRGRLPDGQAETPGNSEP
jgi:hypothetical protein